MATSDIREMRPLQALRAYFADDPSPPTTQEWKELGKAARAELAQEALAELSEKAGIPASEVKFLKAA